MNLKQYSHSIWTYPPHQDAIVTTRAITFLRIGNFYIKTSFDADRLDGFIDPRYI